MKGKTTWTPGSNAFPFKKEMALVSYVPETPSSKIYFLLLSSVLRDKSLANSGKPTITEDYKRRKGRVDAFDQMCNQFSCGRKTKRWPLCLFFGMLNAGVINSWIFHGENIQKAGGTHIQRKKIMKVLSTELVKPWAVHRLASQTLPRQLCNL